MPLNSSTIEFWKVYYYYTANVFIVCEINPPVYITLPRNELLGGGIGSNGFHIKLIFDTQDNQKNSYSGGRF